MNPTAWPKGVIFDVDGVLLASPHERAWREALERLMSNEWLSLGPKTSYRPDRFTSLVYQEAVAGKPRLMGAQATLEYFGIPNAPDRATQYAEQKQARLVELISEGQVAAFPDAVRFAIALKHLGIRLALASSSANADAMLRTIDFGPYAESNKAAGGSAGKSTLLELFDADVSGREVPHGKPAPDLFLLAASELGIDPTGSLVVEDAPAGVIAARAGGMKALGVARAEDEALLTNAGADLVVTSLDQVDANALAAGELRPRDA